MKLKFKDRLYLVASKGSWKGTTVGNQAEASCAKTIEISQVLPFTSSPVRYVCNEFFDVTDDLVILVILEQAGEMCPAQILTHPV